MSVPSAVPSLLGGPVRGVGATMARWGGRAPDFVPHNMVRFLIRRLGFVALTLVLASVIVFVATQVLPGDVARAVLGRSATEQALDNLREQLGLNRPLIVQYLDLSLIHISEPTRLR